MTITEQSLFEPAFSVPVSDRYDDYHAWSRGTPSTSVHVSLEYLVTLIEHKSSIICLCKDTYISGDTYLYISPDHLSIPPEYRAVPVMILSSIKLRIQRYLWHFVRLISALVARLRVNDIFTINLWSVEKKNNVKENNVKLIFKRWKSLLI